ncbi:MAG: Wzz/FepE/Etk N-terminal domain-containing protein, partial [Ramlibacter sp.]
MSDITNDDEISLTDILGFLQESWASIAGVGVAGLLAAGGFLAVAPPKYEAQVMIEMAQIRGGGPNGTVTLNPVEPASLLIERLKNPST